MEIMKRKLFLGIIFLRREVSTLVQTFYKMLFMNKFEFSSLLDCFVWISEMLQGWYVGVPPFNAFLVVVSIGKICIYIKQLGVIRERTMLFSKGKERDNANKVKSPPTLSLCCRNLKSKKTIQGGGDCEQHGANVLKFCPNSVQEYTFSFRSNKKSERWR